MPAKPRPSITLALAEVAQVSSQCIDRLTTAMNQLELSAGSGASLGTPLLQGITAARAAACRVMVDLASITSTADAALHPHDAGRCGDECWECVADTAPRVPRPHHAGRCGDEWCDGTRCRKEGQP